MEQAIIHLKPTYYGNTKQVVQFRVDYKDVTNATASLVVYDSQKKVLKTYTVGTGLTVAPPYTIELNKHVVTVPVGKNTYELTVTYADGEVYSWFAGNWEIR